MAIDTALKAFLDLNDGDIPAYAQARAAEVGLPLPEPTLAAVHENLALLRAQTALFVAALGDKAGDAPETFQP
jgi:hypothetical protein